MKIRTGTIVEAVAGRDSGGLFAVVGCEEGYCLIADGKSRKLAAPKRKNLRHVRATNGAIDMNDITDKKLRAALRSLAEE